MKYLWVLVFTVVLISSCSAKTQNRPGYLDQPGELKPIGSMVQGRTYPLIIFLPYTTGSAQDFYRRCAKTVDECIKNGSYWCLTPKGTVSSSDYLPDFQSYVKWYEERLVFDIKEAFKNPLVDKKAIYLAGYSLGGDLTWALSVRGKFPLKGAFVLSSRCSYPADNLALEALRKQGFRLSLAIGESDENVRRSGMKYALSLVKKSGINVDYFTFPGDHNIPQDQTFIRGFSFILNH